MSQLARLLLALTVAAPTLCIAQDQWPQFLGPGASATGQGARSLRFDRELDLRFRTALPSGASSPCIYGKLIFLTGVVDAEDGKQLAMFALDRDSGKEVWRHTVALGEPRDFLHKDGGIAMPTACTNGKRVFFYFAPYGLLARTLKGELVWEKRLPPPKTDFGIGSSPTLCGDRVILVRDGCPDARIYALDEATGEEAWAVARPRFWETHTTPYVWKNDERTEVVIASSGTVIALDPASGEEHWRVEGLTPLVCTTPSASAERLIFAGWSTPSAAGVDRVLDGLAAQIEFTEKEREDPAALFQRLDSNGDGKISKSECPAGRMRDAWSFFDRNGDDAVNLTEWTPLMRMPTKGKNVMIAIKAGGSGDITKTHVEWTVNRGIPYVASPLLYGDRVYLAKAGGIVGAYDVASGAQVVKRSRLDDTGEYYATPLGVDDHVVVCSAGGSLYVLDANKDLATVASIDFGEAIFATPAIVDGVVYVRTQAALYAFGK